MNHEIFLEISQKKGPARRAAWHLLDHLWEIEDRSL